MNSMWTALNTEEVWSRFGTDLRRYVTRRIPSDDVDDVVQDVFERVHKFFGDFSEEALEQSKFLIDRLIELGAGRAR